MIKGPASRTQAFGAAVGVILFVAVATVVAILGATVVEEGGVNDTWEVFE